MTLIAAWLEQGIPVLIGDLLISDPRGYLPHTNIPTRDNLDEILPASRSHSIVDLVQKIYIICDTLCVAWDDREITARDIIKLLSDSFHDKAPTLEELKQVLTSIKAEPNACGIIGWIVDKNIPYCFKWKSSSPQNFPICSSPVLGSGITDFMAREPLYNSALSPIESAIAKTIGELLKNEVLYGDNLRKFYGGGFQIIHWTGDKFSFVPSITLIFSRIEETQDVMEYNIIPGKRILKLQQDGDRMCINALRIDDETVGIGEYPKNDSEYELYDIPSFLTVSKTADHHIDTPLESAFYCVCLDIKLREQVHVIPTGRYVTVTLNIPIANEKRDGLIRIIKDNTNSSETIELTNGFFSEIVNRLNSLDRPALVRRLMIQENE